ncbi:MAG: HD-GYP domain-containing protein, partial [Planctomycetota bacterium]
VHQLQGKIETPAPAKVDEVPLPEVTVPKAPTEEIIVEKKIDTGALTQVTLELAKPEEMTEEHVAAAIDQATDLKVTPTGDSLEKQLSDQRMVMQTEEEKQTFVDIYQTCVDCTREIFSRLSADGRIDGNAVRQVIEQAVAALIRNRELLMAAGQINLPDNYLVSHSVAVAALSVNIGCSMGFSMDQVLSLGIGGLLADVGMVKIAPEIRNHEGQLATREWQEIQRHPTYGLDMLQSIIGIPAEIPFIVYQSHERSDGSGYPKGKKDIIIHTFAKIVATADIYHSIISKRPHRNAMTPYEAMEQLVLMCGKKQLDPMVVRAFLKCNSMFPVGSWVEVNEKVKARVVAANAGDFMRPVVTPVFDVTGNKLGALKRIDLLENKNLNVTKALDDDQVKSTETMEGF